MVTRTALPHNMPACRPRSWRRPPHLPLCQAQGPQHRRKGALEDSAVMLSSLPLSAPNEYARAHTDYTSCIPSSSVTNVRNMLESCDNRARGEKRNGEMFRRHAERSKMADSVIDTLSHPRLMQPGVGMYAIPCSLSALRYLCLQPEWVSGSIGTMYASS